MRLGAGYVENRRGDAGSARYSMESGGRKTVARTLFVNRNAEAVFGRRLKGKRLINCELVGLAFFREATACQNSVGSPDSYCLVVVV